MPTKIYESSTESQLTNDKNPVYQLDEKELKKIINNWHRLIIVCSVWFLMVLGSVFFVFSMVTSVSTEESLPPILVYIYCLFGGIGLLSAISIYGTITKKGWGRIVGIVTCCIMFLSPPIGPIIGALGLFGFSGAKPLFGANRLNYSEIKLAYKQIKDSEGII